MPTDSPVAGQSPSPLHPEKSYLTGKSVGFFFHPKPVKLLFIKVKTVGEIFGIELKTSASV